MNESGVLKSEIFRHETLANRRDFDCSFASQLVALDVYAQSENSRRDFSSYGAKPGKTKILSTTRKFIVPC